MNRYVDLSEKVTATYYDEQYEEWDHRTVTIEDVLNEVCDDYTVLPTVEPRTGKWIPHHDKVMLFDGMSIGGMTCSVCGWNTHNKMHLIFGCPYKYCPNCGSLNEESEHYTMEEFMFGQDLGNPEDGSL